MVEKQADRTGESKGAGLKLHSGVPRRGPLAPYDYTIDGARLGNLTGRELKALVERLQDQSGAALAERLMAENHLGECRRAVAG